MTIEEKLQEAIESKKLFFNQKIQEFNQKKKSFLDASGEQVSQLDSWKEQRIVVEKKLDELIHLQEPILRQKLISILNVKSKGYSYNNSDINFDKLVYFVDRVNELNTPEYVFKHNKKYCTTVLNTIADEYLKIKGYLAQQEIEKSKGCESQAKQNESQISKIFAEYKALILSEWERLCSNEIISLAKLKAEEVISSVKSSALS